MEIFRQLFQFADVFGSCAAAAADYSDAFPDGEKHLLREILCTDVEIGHVAVAFRQACVRLEDNGDRAVFQKLVHNSLKLFRAEGAVCADRINAHSLKHSRHTRRICARHKTAVFAVSVGDKDRQIAVFLCGKNGCLGFVAVVHRFNRDEVGSVFNTEPYRFGKNLNRFFKVEITEGLQKLSCRADIKRNKLFLLSRRGLSRFIDIFYSTADYFVQLVTVKFQNICPERVCADNVASAVVIISVYIRDCFGMCNVPTFGQLTRGQSALLQESSQSSVKDNDIVFYKFTNVHRDTSCRFVIPANAVTDFDGDIKRESPRVTPILLGQSSREKIIF